LFSEINSYICSIMQGNERYSGLNFRNKQIRFLNPFSVESSLSKFLDSI
jgi:hypothetical protein